MIKLNTNNIEQARKYFLSENEEERSAIENSLQQTTLLSFLEQLKQAFNNTEDKAVYNMVQGTDNEIYLHALLQIQEDYYTKLAIRHISGIAHADIALLVEKSHPAFFNEVNFQKELVIAIKLHERAALKSKFEFFDNEAAINTEELNRAFKLGERKNLKEQFREIEQEAVPAGKSSAPVIHFKWKRFAVAASLATLIITITFLLLNQNKKQPHLAALTDAEKQHISDSIANRKLVQQKINDQLNRVDITFTEKKDTVAKGFSLGFAQKPETVIIRLYYLVEEISKIDQTLSDVQDIKGFEKALDSLRSKKNAMQHLENKYRFNNDTLLLYLTAKKEVKIFKPDATYFMKIGSEVFYCNRSSSFLMLKPAGKAITNKINELIY